MNKPAVKTLLTLDKLTLKTKLWYAADPNKPDFALGNVLLVHGFGEHSGRYGPVVAALTSRGFNVLAFDLRGHGQSEGQRGYIAHYDQFLQDMQLVLDFAQNTFAGNWVLYGHSMGGGIVLNYILKGLFQPTSQAKLKGAVVTSPWLLLANPPNALTLTSVKLIQFFYPKFAIMNKFKQGSLSRDPNVEELYRNDPLVHGRVSAKLFFGVCEAGQWALMHAHQLEVPVLLAHGADDPVTSITASQKFHEVAPKHYLHYKIWPGAKHETHNETNKEEVIAYYADWVVGLFKDSDSS